MRLLLILSISLLTGCADPSVQQAWFATLSTEDLCDRSIAEKRLLSGEHQELDTAIASRGTTCQAVFKSMTNNRLCESSISAIRTPPSGRRSLDQEIESRRINCQDLSWQSWQNKLLYNRQENRLLSEQQAAFRRSSVGSAFQAPAQNTESPALNVESLIIVGGAMSAASTPRAVGRLPNDDIPLSAGFTCPLRSSAASGMYRNCSYDCAGGIVVQSVSASTFCPTSIRR
jgi:hypothetical protein